MTHNTAQPIPDTEGEWRTVETINRSSIVDEFGELVAIGCGKSVRQRREHATQIVADHKAAKSQALLVEALRALKERAEFSLSTPGMVRGRDALKNAIEAASAALKAAGVNE